MSKDSEEKWIKEYHNARAFWIHDYDPKRPHVVMPGNLHSNGYFNSDPVAETPFLLGLAIEDLAELMIRAGVDLAQIDRVVGPFESAATIAHDLARIIVKKTGFGPRYGNGKQLCKFAYAEKDERDVRLFPRAEIRPGEQVLVCEDVLLTGRNAVATATAAEACGATVLPFFIALVNRTGQDEIHGKRIIALISRALPMWGVTECPLCAKGSEAIDPKPRENWARLNAGYTNIARLSI